MTQVGDARAQFCGENSESERRIERAEVLARSRRQPANRVGLSAVRRDHEQESVPCLK